MMRYSLLLAVFCVGASARANPPVVQYLFPAGARQGTTVDLRVGGIDLNRRCGFEMIGPGIDAPKQLERAKKTIWFEGPLLPLPESQQQEDYPRDMTAQIKIAADAPLGIRHARAWTSQGTSPALKFMVGDLPEVMENEIDGEAVPEEVTLPVTANGRIFPREDVDIWSFVVKRGQTVTCEVHAARLGSPLDALLQVVDPHGKTIAENDDTFGSDSFIRFTAAEDGKYQVHIRDVNFRGGQAFVYRLTVSAGPHVDRVYPLGGKRGGTAKFELAGSGVPVGPIDIAIPADAPRDFSHRLTLGAAKSNPILLETDDLPEFLEAEPNDLPRQTKPVAVPAVLNGRIDKPGDRDCWAIAMKKGEALEFDLRAHRLGSPLSGVLTLRDAAGKELARADNVGGPQLDPQLRFTASADGVFHVCVAERFRERGGPEFAYRLRVDKPEAAGFTLRMASDAVTLERGKQATLRLLIERRGGFAAPINLAVEGLPPEVTLATPTIAANQPTVDMILKAGATAPIRTGRLIITGTAKVGDKMLTAKATAPAPRGMAELDSALLAVALPTPFKIKGDHDFRWAARGTVMQRRYQIDRGGFAGPIEVTLADRQARHLQGVTGPTIIVPADAKEFDFPVELPPWMEMGRTCRVCVSASATLKDTDGSEHTVSFSSVQANEQLIAVIGPERLSLELEKTSLVVTPGQKIELPLKIARGKELQGAVKLEVLVPAHMQGITAAPVTIAADKNSGTLTIQLGEKMGPLNAPLVIRATLMDKGKPVVAEVKIEMTKE